MRATYGQDNKRENLTKKLSLFNPDYNPDNYKKGKKKNENNRKENPATVLSGSPGGKRRTLSCEKMKMMYSREMS